MKIATLLKWGRFSLWGLAQISIPEFSPRMTMSRWERAALFNYISEMTLYSLFVFCAAAILSYWVGAIIFLLAGLHLLYSWVTILRPHVRNLGLEDLFGAHATNSCNIHCKLLQEFTIDLALFDVGSASTALIEQIHPFYHYSWLTPIWVLYLRLFPPSPLVCSAVAYARHVPSVRALSHSLQNRFRPYNLDVLAGLVVRNGNYPALALLANELVVSEHADSILRSALIQGGSVIPPWLVFEFIRRSQTTRLDEYYFHEDWYTPLCQVRALLEREYLDYYALTHTLLEARAVTTRGNYEANLVRQIMSFSPLGWIPRIRNQMITRALPKSGL